MRRDFFLRPNKSIHLSSKMPAEIFKWRTALTWKDIADELGYELDETLRKKCQEDFFAFAGAFNAIYPNEYWRPEMVRIMHRIMSYRKAYEVNVRKNGN